MSKIETGSFISLEGPEGSGKSTQALMLSRYLESIGINSVRTREPGGVSISENLRSLLLNPGSIISPRTELLLYAAGRSQHTDELIQPALSRGDFVISERYTHASLAYQGYGRGLDLNLINKLNYIATGGVSPDLVILLDIESSRGLKRVESSGRDLDRLESEDMEFHRRVREGYLEMAGRDETIEVVDSSLPLQQVHGIIIKLIKKHELIN